jgi:hypothetical protein
MQVIIIRTNKIVQITPGIEWIFVLRLKLSVGGGAPNKSILSRMDMQFLFFPAVLLTI